MLLVCGGKSCLLHGNHNVIMVMCNNRSRIYTPRFATLTLVESVGGAYMWDLTFYLANTPPLPVPHLNVDIILYYRQIEAANLPSLLVQKLMVKID